MNWFRDAPSAVRDEISDVGSPIVLQITTYISVGLKFLPATTSINFDALPLSTIPTPAKIAANMKTSPNRSSGLSLEAEWPVHSAPAMKTPFKRNITTHHIAIGKS